MNEENKSTPRDWMLSGLRMCILDPFALSCCQEDMDVALVEHLHQATSRSWVNHTFAK